MRTCCLTRSTIRLALLLLLAHVAAPALRAATEVRFKLAEDTLILVPVTANGQGPFYFLFDTGTDVTIIDTALARKLALTPLQSAHMTTVTDIQTVTVSRLAKLTLGGIEMHQLPVFEKDLSSLHRIDGKIAGIIGQDFLSHSSYLLNYRARSILFEQGQDIRDQIDGDEVPIETDDDEMILPAEADYRGHADLRLILDSGTNTLVLMGPSSAPLHCSTEQLELQTSTSGTALARHGLVDLTVASHRFLDLHATLAIDAPPQENSDGLLPMALFDSIYVNNVEGFVMLNPRARPQLRQAATGGSQKTIHADR